ncbi:ankyrin repeat-containing domain protein [Xylaria longipes]|nr:ankyrin repeat-containing domain protein [Xylaria longipes]
MIKAAIPLSRDCLGPRDNLVLDEEIIVLLSDAGIMLNKITEEDKDILHLAIDRSCNWKTIEYLLSCVGMTMLHSACASKSRDRLKIVGLLLLRESSWKEWDGPTILESALTVSWLEKVQENVQLFSFLLERGYPLEGPKERLPTAKKKWSSILTMLLANNTPDALIYQIIQQGADINSPGFIGHNMYTPLQFAVKNGCFNIAQHLISQGADINASTACNPELGAKISLGFIHPNHTPLHCAVKGGSMGAFCLLLDAGANFHAMIRTLSWGEQNVLDSAAFLGATSFKQGLTPYDGIIELANRKGHFASERLRALGE